MGLQEVLSVVGKARIQKVGVAVGMVADQVTGFIVEPEAFYALFIQSMGVGEKVTLPTRYLLRFFIGVLARVWPSR
ncbi:hypothetical protein Q5Y71_11045 [Microbulbifer sp. 2205BS26-8]|nr:hypothetical protein [Microbulbifer sp. 2205BS26-8]MDP5210258.1 hypothetical protein [Microbulbifer sp. 2205BS26-8]